MYFDIFVISFSSFQADSCWIAPLQLSAKGYCLRIQKHLEIAGAAERPRSKKQQHAETISNTEQHFLFDCLARKHSISWHLWMFFRLGSRHTPTIGWSLGYIRSLVHHQPLHISRINTPCFEGFWRFQDHKKSSGITYIHHFVDSDRFVCHSTASLNNMPT